MNKWIKEAKENWIYIFAFVLIVLFVWMYSSQNEVLVESGNEENQAIGVVESPEKDEEVKGESTEVKIKKTATTQPQPTVAAAVEELEEEEVKESVTLSVVGKGDYSVDITEGDTAFDVLLRAATTNGFKVGYKSYSFGRMVTQIGDVKAESTSFWALYYNGESSMVGADDIDVVNGDIIKWQYEEFTW